MGFHAWDISPLDAMGQGSGTFPEVCAFRHDLIQQFDVRATYTDYFAYMFLCLLIHALTIPRQYMFYELTMAHHPPVFA